MRENVKNSSAVCCVIKLKSRAEIDFFRQLATLEVVWDEKVRSQILTPRGPCFGGPRSPKMSNIINKFSRPTFFFIEPQIQLWRLVKYIKFGLE